MKNVFLFLVLFWISYPAFGQIVRFNTPFPTADEELTLTFLASEGNGGLENCNCDVYLHTGVTPVGGPDWQYVQGEWGQEIPRLKMTRVAANVHTFQFTIRDFYGLPADLEVDKLSFVFRNADGTLAGRNPDGSDIFVEIFNANDALLTRLEKPLNTPLVLQDGEMVDIRGFASRPSQIRIEENGTVLAQSAHDTTVFGLEYLPVGDPGRYRIDFIANSEGLEDTTSFTYFLAQAPNIADPPAEAQLGLNRNDDGSFTILLEAPGKSIPILLHNGNNFTPTIADQMNVSPDGTFSWIEVNPPTDEDWFIYQFLVDGTLKVADPYAELVLDPVHDPFIETQVNDDFPEYPEGGEGLLALARLNPEPYPWQTDDFSPAPVEDLFIYELHLRDFLPDHSYQTLIDTLDYLERLGVNAIELMPVNEFEGNDSWGYNPSFQMALDKYYGSPEDFKAFVDAAHARGMAVILDIVLNHVFSQSPLAQLYWDAANFRPAADNPWLNPTPRHPFNVGSDVNHESPATKRWVSRVIQYWFDEYRIDGYRFDLSKGLTQVNSGSDVGAWGRYDGSRIAILKDIGDQIWENNPEAILILEHFADNDEETELAEYGFLLWGKMTDPYNEATMGYHDNNKSDLSGGFYGNRNWSVPHLVTYMESHDEERLMFKNLEFGNSSGDYDVRDEATALDRIEMAHTFFWTVPGPKMMWQFGELGYEIPINFCIQDGSIDEGCRTGRKPIRWNYFQETDRRDLYDYVSDLTWLRDQYPNTFRDATPKMDVRSSVKRIEIDGPDLTAHAIGNFDVQNQSINTTFPFPGWWYDYVSGDSLLVENTMVAFDLEPGQHYLWLDQRVQRPSQSDMPVSASFVASGLKQFDLAPNPVSAGQTLLLRWSGLTDNHYQVGLLNLQGQRLWAQQLNGAPEGASVTLPQVARGMYLLELRASSGQVLGVRRVVVE